MAQWSPGKNVVVLGAGATRGAKWVETQEPHCLPPLNADFFTQLQRVRSTQHQKVVDAVVNDAVSLYGPNFKVTLEQYFTQLETLLGMAELLDLGSGEYTRKSLSRMRLNLLSALSAVLEESADVVKSASPAKGNRCGYHDKLVGALAARDTIISFNYDCVIDHALRSTAEGRWAARYGYCFKNPARVRGSDPWDAENAPVAENQSINLLKLHGSLNFFPFPSEEGGLIRLRQRTYLQRGRQHYEIIPPEFAKKVDRPEYKTLWQRAELALRGAHQIVLIGFSFTQTDMAVDSFFRSALAANKALETLIIVNPSPGDRRRIREIFSKRLARGSVRVVQFDRFSDFAPHAAALLS